MAILALLWPAAALRAAVKTTWSDAPAREFVFVKTTRRQLFVTGGR